MVVAEAGTDEIGAPGFCIHMGKDDEEYIMGVVRMNIGRIH